MGVDTSILGKKMWSHFCWQNSGGKLIGRNMDFTYFPFFCTVELLNVFKNYVKNTMTNLQESGKQFQ